MQELNDWEICFIVSGCEIELERTTIESHANKEACLPAPKTAWEHLIQTESRVQLLPEPIQNLFVESFYFVRQILKFGPLTDECKFNDTGRSIPLLAHNDFGHPSIGLVLIFFVQIFPIHEQNYISILFDRP